MAGLGAHSWTSAKDGTDPAWANMYFNPDGPAKVFIGSTTPWTEDQGILCVDNTAGAVGIGTSTPSEALHVVGTSLFANEVKIGSLGENPGILNVYQNDASDQPAQINLKNGGSTDRLSISANDDTAESVIASTNDNFWITNNSRTIYISAGTINLNGSVSINNTPLSTSQLINIINGGNLYLWSNFR
jgi:hypothetical protein